MLTTYKENYRGAYSKYELLNFAVGGFSALQELMVLENKAFPFQPDSIFYVAHPIEIERSIRMLWDRVRAGIEPPYDYLREIVQQAEIVEEMPSAVAVKHLKPFGEQLISWIYHRIVEHSRQHGSLPVWILLPMEPGAKNPPEEEIVSLIRLAEEAGFIVLNLLDVYEDQDVESLQTATWDWHPNAKAHKLIADRLYNELRGKEQILSHGLSTQ